VQAGRQAERSSNQRVNHAGGLRVVPPLYSDPAGWDYRGSGLFPRAWDALPVHFYCSYSSTTAEAF